MNWKRGMFRAWMFVTGLYAIGAVTVLIVEGNSPLWWTRPVLTLASISNTYLIKAPDGHTYEIDGPAGATDNDVLAKVIEQHPDADPWKDFRIKGPDATPHPQDGGHWELVDDAPSHGPWKKVWINSSTGYSSGGDYAGRVFFVYYPLSTDEPSIKASIVRMNDTAVRPPF